MRSPGSAREDYRGAVKLAGSARDGAGMQVRRLVRDRLEVAYRDAQERVRDEGVELTATAPRDLAACLGDIHRAPVGTVARHRVERVGHGEDARAQRDRVAGEAVRIALAVLALVMVADDACDVGEERNA